MALDYTKASFEELVAEIQRALAAASSNPGVWQDNYQSSTAQILVQTIAFMTDNLLYTLQRRTQENFITTARLASSVGAIAALLGYRARRILSATGVVRLTLDATVAIGATVIIPKYTNITFEDDMFTTLNQHSILQGDFFVDIPVAEGVVEEIRIDTSTGIVTQNNTTKTITYNLSERYVTINDYSDIENDSLVIFTKNFSTLNVVDNFNDVSIQSSVGVAPAGAISFASPTATVFDVRLSNDGLRILFGDGTFGKIPTDTLVIQWIKSTGPKFNLSSVGEIFSIPTLPSLTDNILPIPNIYNYTLSNVTPINGGVFGETIEQIKLHAPDFVRTGNRAVTRHDFSFWTKNSGVGGIVDATAYGEEELGIDVINTNTVRVVYLQNDGSKLTPDETTSLKNFLDAYKIISTLLIFEQATNIPLDIDVKMVANPNLSMAESQLIDLVKQALTTFFTIKEGSLGRSIRHSEIVQFLHNFKAIDQTGVLKNIAQSVTVEIRAIKEIRYNGSGNIVTTIPIPVLKQPGIPQNFLLPTSLGLFDTSGVSIGGIVDIPNAPILPRLTPITGLFGAGSINYDTGALVVNIGNLPAITPVAGVGLVTSVGTTATISPATSAFNVVGATDKYIIVGGVYRKVLSASLVLGNTVLVLDAPFVPDITGPGQLWSYVSDAVAYIVYGQNSCQNFESDSRSVILYDSMVLTPSLSTVVISAC